MFKSPVTFPEDISGLEYCLPDKLNPLPIDKVAVIFGSLTESHLL